MLNNYWSAIVAYMDEEIREQVHFELAPCTNEEFLKRYLALDEAFDDVLYQEFREVWKEI